MREFFISIIEFVIIFKFMFRVGHFLNLIPTSIAITWMDKVEGGHAGAKGTAGKAEGTVIL